MTVLRSTCTVSVVIPAYNAEAYLDECLSSVFAQAGSFSMEVIVVDDGSTDGTAAAAGRHDKVRLIRQGNRGPAAARNVGVAAAGGDFIAFLDADDIWPPGSVAARLEVLLRQPDAGMVLGDCRQFDDAGLWLESQFSSGGLGRKVWGDDDVVPDAYRRLLEDNFITTGSVIARKVLLTEVGHFDEGLRLVEDLDLWLRIARRHPIAWCADLCLMRRRHTSNTSTDSIAMSLAFLAVLHKQSRFADSEDESMSGQLRRLIAREHLYLTRLLLQRGRYGMALRHARHGLAALPDQLVSWRERWMGASTSKGRRMP